MSYLLFSAVLTSASPATGETAPRTTPDELAERLSAEVRTGTLLFSRGDCLAVKVFGGGPYTHVAAVVVQEGEPLVFDSHNRQGVRRLSLAEYLHSQQPDRLHVLHPLREFDEPRTKAFVAHLEGEVGRPYGVRHHLTGRRAEGVHCSEYVTDALMAAALLRAERPPRVSPASLAEGILSGGLYAEAASYEFGPPSEPPPQAANRCHQLWIDTKLCTIRFCGQLRRWILCR